MAFRNTSPSFKTLNSEEFDDMPIVPPKPIVQKEYKEEIPDISVVSLISDNGPQFQRNFLKSQNGCNFLQGNINHTSYQERSGINLYGPNSFNYTAEKSNGIIDDTISTSKLCASCNSCVLNKGIIANHRSNEQHDLKNKSEDRETVSNKTCKCLDSNIIACSNYKSDTSNLKQLPGALNSNEPEPFQIVNNPDCCCNKDQHYKLRKSLSEYERHENKILCPVCFKKSCKCNFLFRKYNANSSKNDICSHITEKLPANTSDEISSIWEYLKQQEEKIDSIHKKMSNFLSQHASCCGDQPTQRKELSNVTERDIPYILNISGEHSDKITELQNEIKLLKLRKQNFSPTNNKIDKSIINQEKISCVNIENCKEAIPCPSSHNETCNELGPKVTKVSTSTMTSFAIENDEKCVYHKQFTVVTDFMRDKKSSLPKEHDILKTKNSLNGKNSNSQKRKSHKLDKSSPILKCKTNVSSNSSSDPHNTSDKQVLKTSRKSDTKPKRVSTENKVTNRRYLKDCSSDNDVEEQKNSPTLKTNARKSHSRSSKQRLKNGMSPKEIGTLKKRDSGNKEMNWETSSSSTDTEFISPKQSQELSEKIELDSEEEPSYLSFATVEYLNKYGLNHSGKTDRTKSSRKTTQSKRYL